MKISGLTSQTSAEETPPPTNAPYPSAGFCVTLCAILLAFHPYYVAAWLPSIIVRADIPQMFEAVYTGTACLALLAGLVRKGSMGILTMLVSVIALLWQLLMPHIAH